MEYLPIILPAGSKELENFRKKNTGKIGNTFDTLNQQVAELHKIRQPSVRFTRDELQAAVKKYWKEHDRNAYGNWVFYPWNGNLLRILPKSEFIEIRTSRNQYKITPREQEILSSKIIGIAGLSVGQSAAATIAMERICGELRLADFDSLDLSNLNRLRASISDIGIPKTVIAARQIAELDPYIHVSIFSDGLTQENLDAFFTVGGTLDLFVEECDSLDIKILSREKARSLGIPVVMDTSDRGMLDIERFDLEPSRPILHGLIQGITSAELRGLSTEQKIPYILPMVGMNRLSTRMKASMAEVEQTINTWPQLASGVTLGGALVADAARRILLGQKQSSGRFYADLEELTSPSANSLKQRSAPAIKNKPFPRKFSHASAIRKVRETDTFTGSGNISKKLADELVKAALLAPSAGNNQPWLWVYRNKRLFMLNNSPELGKLHDPGGIINLTSLGCALENVRLVAAEHGFLTHWKWFPGGKRNLIAVVDVVKSKSAMAEPGFGLAKYIESRQTIRQQTPAQKFPAEVAAACASVIGNDDVSISFAAPDDIPRLAEMISTFDRLRFYHPQLHEELYKHEFRHAPQAEELTHEGLDLRVMELTPSDTVGVQTMSDGDVVQFLRKEGLGNGLKSMSRKSILNASGIGLISVKGTEGKDILEAGQIIQRVWLTLEKNGWGIHPYTSIPYFTALEGSGYTKGFTAKEIQYIRSSKNDICDIFHINKYMHPLFLFKLIKPVRAEQRASRLDIKSLYLQDTDDY